MGATIGVEGATRPLLPAVIFVLDPNKGLLPLVRVRVGW